MRGAADRLALVALIFGALPSTAGCVNVYQPLLGLQTPVVVDPQRQNFNDLRLAVRCVPRDFLNPKDAKILCDRVEELFVAQGAKVQTYAGVSKADDDGSEEGAAAAKTRDASPRPDLTLELRARLLNKDTSALMWIFSLLTLTLAPAMSEYSYVQEVVIRGQGGTLLASAELKGRLVRYYGLGAWAGTRLVNLIFRDDDEDQTNRAFRRGISDDLYGQLSQMVFNSKMRQRVLTRPVSTSSVARAGG